MIGPTKTLRFKSLILQMKKVEKAHIREMTSSGAHSKLLRLPGLTLHFDRACWVFQAIHQNSSHTISGLTQLDG